MTQRPEVHIVDMVSELTTVSESDVLSPQMIQRIVLLAVRAMNEQRAHEERAAAERQVNRGARDTAGGAPAGLSARS